MRKCNKLFHSRHNCIQSSSPQMEILLLCLHHLPTGHFHYRQKSHSHTHLWGCSPCNQARRRGGAPWSPSAPHVSCGSRWCVAQHGTRLLSGSVRCRGRGRRVPCAVALPAVQGGSSGTATSTAPSTTDGSAPHENSNVIKPQGRMRVQPKLLL